MWEVANNIENGLKGRQLLGEVILLVDEMVHLLWGGMSGTIRHISMKVRIECKPWVLGDRTY